MGIIGWLILSFGALGAVYGSDCLPATAMCSHFWTKIEPHKNLMESEQELNSWCRKQTLFFRCLEDIFLVIYGNYSNFPTNMLVSKMFTEDLCLEGSTSRKRYLDNAACINQLDMDYCTMPEYLEIITPDGSVPTKCSLAEKTSSCAAATIVSRCGLDAGRLYRYLSRIVQYDEVCGKKFSGATAACEIKADSELSEIYYGLVHRFGTIPEQPSEIYSLKQESKILSYESISEDLMNTFDGLYSSEGDASLVKSTVHRNQVNRSQDKFRMKPIISEPFKGLLFYNYSDEEFAFYWRQPGSFPISRVTCEHVLESNKKGVMFACYLYYKEPECVKLSDEEETITPELIRDIDLTIPADGTLDISDKPDWTGALRDYKRHRLSWEFFFNGKVVTEDRNIRKTNEEMVVESPNSDTCLKELRFYDILNDHYVDWWQCPNLFSDELRNEILTFLFPNQTRDMDFFSLSSTNENATDGGYHTYVHFFEPVLHGFEKMTCERVNECHPRGRGVYKCLLERRGIEGCDSCCVQFPYSSEECPTKRKARSMETEDGKKHSELFPTFEVGSGVFEESPGEDETFMVSNEETSSSDESTDFVTAVMDDNGDLIAIDLSELPDNSDSSSEANLVLLNSSDSSEDSVVTEPEDNLDTLQQATSYGSLSKPELMLLKNNIFVLQSVPSVADFEETYEILKSKD